MIAAVNRSPRCDLRRVGVHDQSEISRLVVLLPIYGRIAIRRYDERAAELSGHVRSSSVSRVRTSSRPDTRASSRLPEFIARLTTQCSSLHEEHVELGLKGRDGIVRMIRKGKFQVRSVASAEC